MLVLRNGANKIRCKLASGHQSQRTKLSARSVNDPLKGWGKSIGSTVPHVPRKLLIPGVERKDDPEVVVGRDGVNAAFGHPFIREL